MTSLLASGAYEAGAVAGTAFRWVFLVAIAVVTVQRLRAGRYSTLRAGVTLAIVGGLVAASLAYYLGGRESATAVAPSVSAAERDAMAGCLDAGAPRDYCECIWDEMVARGDLEADFDAVARASETGRVPGWFRALTQRCAA